MKKKKRQYIIEQLKVQLHKAENSEDRPTFAYKYLDVGPLNPELVDRARDILSKEKKKKYFKLHLNFPEWFPVQLNHKELTTEEKEEIDKKLIAALTNPADKPNKEKQE